MIYFLIRRYFFPDKDVLYIYNRINELIKPLLAKTASQLYPLYNDWLSKPIKSAIYIQGVINRFEISFYFFFYLT